MFVRVVVVWTVFFGLGTWEGFWTVGHEDGGGGLVFDNANIVAPKDGNQFGDKLFPNCNFLSNNVLKLSHKLWDNLLIVVF